VTAFENFHAKSQSWNDDQTVHVGKVVDNFIFWVISNRREEIGGCRANTTDKIGFCCHSNCVHPDRRVDLVSVR
jgi:hypothetical protein